jgi:hypothetical protein
MSPKKFTSVYPDKVFSKKQNNFMVSTEKDYLLRQTKFNTIDFSYKQPQLWNPNRFYDKLVDLYPAVCSGFLLSAISFFFSSSDLISLRWIQVWRHGHLLYRLAYLLEISWVLTFYIVCCGWENKIEFFNLSNIKEIFFLIVIIKIS